MTSRSPDQVHLHTYVDIVNGVGVTNAAAIQGYWGKRQVASQVGSVGGPLVNLHLKSNQVLSEVMACVGMLATGRLIVKSYSTNCKITNLDRGNVEIMHYRCRARHDFSAAGAAELSTIIGVGFGDSVATANVGDAIFNAPINNSTFGGTLFMNPRFTAHVKILKVKTRTLKPCATWFLGYKTRKPSIHPLERFNYGVLPSATGAVLPFREISRGQTFSVFMARGTIATNQSAPAAGHQIGICNWSLGFVYQVKLHYLLAYPEDNVSSAVTQGAAFSVGVDRVPAPLIINQPNSTIDALGARIYAAAGQDRNAVQNVQQVGP